MDKVIEIVLSRRSHGLLFMFWIGPGMMISIALRQSILWVAFMSAYANLMLHLIEWHQARKSEKEGAD